MEKEPKKIFSQNVTFKTWVGMSIIILTYSEKNLNLKTYKKHTSRVQGHIVCLHGNPHPCLAKCTFCPGEVTRYKLRAALPEKWTCVVTEVYTRRIQKSKGQKQYTKYNFHCDNPYWSTLQESPEVILFNKVTVNQVCQCFRITLKATSHSNHAVIKVAAWRV